MLKLGIISNPFAKMNKNHPEHNTQMWYTLANEGQYKVTHSILELEQVCQEFFERKINLVGIVGGDGSIGLVLSNLLKAYGHEHDLPKILLLKGGTINFLASNLEIHSSALTCLNDTLHFIKNKMALFETPVRTIKVNGRLGFIFAGGIATNFLEEFYKNKTNSFGAAVVLSKYFLDAFLLGKLNGKFKTLFQPLKLKISAEPDDSWSTQYPSQSELPCSLIFASTVPKLPLHFHLFKKIRLKDKTAELFIVTKKGIPLLVKGAQTFFGFDITNNLDIFSVLFKKVKIQGEQNLSYSLDGDLYTAEEGNIDIEYGPTFVFCSPYPQ
jgi:diacylglycerol kinase family enzyme